MLKKVFLTVFAITLILGVAITANLLVDTSPKLITAKETAANPASTNTLGSKLSTAEESKVKSGMDPDIDPGVDLAMLSDIDEIVTKHGDFVRVEIQTIFYEPEIARQLN